MESTGRRHVLWQKERKSQEAKNTKMNTPPSTAIRRQWKPKRPANKDHSMTFNLQKREKKDCGERECSGKTSKATQEEKIIQTVPRSKVRTFKTCKSNCCNCEGKSNEYQDLREP